MIAAFVFKIIVAGFQDVLLIRILLRTTNGIFKFISSKVVLSFPRDRLRHTDSYSLKLKFVFSSRGFCVFFLPYALCDNQFSKFCRALLCFEAFVLKFRKRASIFVLFLSAILFAPAQFCRSCQSFQVHCFALNFTFLHW